APELGVGLRRAPPLVPITVELVGKIRLPREPWDFYLGVGPALVIDKANNASTDAGGGFNILLGVEHPKGLFTELKVGMADSPSVKFCVGDIFGGVFGGGGGVWCSGLGGGEVRPVFFAVFT